MNRKIAKIIEWKDRMLEDIAFSIFEAFVVLLITFLYLIVLSINYGLDTEGINYLGALINTITSTLHPTEMIIYITGVLSSTTAYFIARLKDLKTHVLPVVFILLSTACLFWITIPLFISGLQSEPANQTFAVWLAKTVGFLALCIWLCSLFIQRRIFKQDITIGGDHRGNEIAKNVGGP